MLITVNSGQESAAPSFNKNSLINSRSVIVRRSEAENRIRFRLRERKVSFYIFLIRRILSSLFLSHSRAIFYGEFRSRIRILKSFAFVLFSHIKFCFHTIELCFRAFFDSIHCHRIRISLISLELIEFVTFNCVTNNPSTKRRIVHCDPLIVEPWTHWTVTGTLCAIFQRSKVDRQPIDY